MFIKELHRRLVIYVQVLQTFADRSWYPSLIALLAALDNLVVIIPTDSILISSSMLVPKRWFRYATSVAIGSTLGALALATLVEFHGLPWIQEVFPSIVQSKMWDLTMTFFDQYGLIVVFIVSATPLMQHPAIIAAGLAAVPLLDLTIVMLAGRLLKFIIMAYIGSHAPKLINKLWGVQAELSVVSTKID